MIVDLLGVPVQKGSVLLETGLTYDPSMDIHDASKVQTFMDSPRKYFYQYILGWRKEEPNIHLVFGSAWHGAMEHLLLSLNTDDPYGDKYLMEAYDLFQQTYMEAFPDPLTHDAHGAKSLGNGLQALVDYTNTWRRSDVGHMTTLYTEVAGSIPISETRLTHFKLDSIVVKNGEVMSLEHKTTGRKTDSWLNKWGVMIQPFVYTHALRALFGDEVVKGTVINGAVLRKSSNEMLRMPVFKNDQQMRAGLWSINHWYDQIRWNTENLLDTTVDDDVMAAFPCNSMSCSKFGCEFMTFCEHWANPLQRADHPPIGFVQEFWDPRRENDDAKYVVHVPEGGSAQIEEVSHED